MAWFSCAIRQPINANTGGITSAYNGLVLHHAVSNAPSLQSLFGTPGFGASAHFYVRQDGVIQQYVDTSVVAWAQGNSTGNATFASVETQGCVSPPYADPMSTAMIDALARLYAEGNARHGWPLQLANAQSQRGFSYHRLWNSTACPCQVRVDTRAEILSRASGTQPTPTPTEEFDEMIAATPPDPPGTPSKGYFTTTRDGAVYAFGNAVYKGNALGKVSGKIVGITAAANDGYWLVASDGGIFAFGSAQYYGRPDRI